VSSGRLIDISTPNVPFMHLSLGLGSKVSFGESTNTPMQSTLLCTLINGSKNFPYYSGNFLELSENFNLSIIFSFPDFIPSYYSDLSPARNLTTEPRQISLMIPKFPDQQPFYEDGTNSCTEFIGCLPRSPVRIQPAFRLRRPVEPIRTRSGTFLIDFTGVTLSEVETLLLSLHFLSQYVFPGSYPFVFRPTWLTQFRPTVKLESRTLSFLSSFKHADRRHIVSFGYCGHTSCCLDRISHTTSTFVHGRCIHCTCPPLLTDNCTLNCRPYLSAYFSAK
jgi:hypothetical protein